MPEGGRIQAVSGQYRAHQNWALRAVIENGTIIITGLLDGSFNFGGSLPVKSAAYRAAATAARRNTPTNSSELY
jgi:hypothetical protein